MNADDKLVKIMFNVKKNNVQITMNRRWQQLKIKILANGSRSALGSKVQIGKEGMRR